MRGNLVSFRIDGQKKLQQVLGDIPEGLEDAAQKAVNAGARWGAAQAAQRIAKAHRLPFKVIRDRASDHNRVAYTTGGRVRAFTTGAIIWIGRNPIKAQYLGDHFQSDKGAGAGGYYWKGSFTATMRSGHSSVFVRRGKRRLPIDEQRAPLTEAPAIAAEINNELPAKLLSLFEREVAK